MKLLILLLIAASCRGFVVSPLLRTPTFRKTSICAVKARKKAKKASFPASGGFGAKKAGVQKSIKFDASSALLRSEKLYEEVSLS